MSDFQRIAERYIQLWNEREPTRRQRLLEDNWLTGATYSDPMVESRAMSSPTAALAPIR